MPIAFLSSFTPSILHDRSIKLRHPLRVIIFQKEEGGLIGSHILASGFDDKLLNTQCQSGNTKRREPVGQPHTTGAGTAKISLTKYVYICRLSRVGFRLRLSPQTIQVLDAFLQAPRAWRYGYDISRDTGIKSGTLYPILMRLADLKLLETRWETTEPGKPPRHMYRLAPDGVPSARKQLRSWMARRPQRAALRPVRG